MMSSKLSTVEMFTDGACRGNPGPGGWGVVLRCKGRERHLSGATLRTTNNQMELQAAISGLAALKKPCVVELTTDSQYLRLGITQWIANWKAKGWLNSKRQPVKNQELWQQLDALAATHTVRWHWVKGHSGHPENELADQLANNALDELLTGS